MHILQMGDSEKMGEEERDQKIIEFFRAVFKTYDSEKAGTGLFPILKSNFKQMMLFSSCPFVRHHWS